MSRRTYACSYNHVGAWCALNRMHGTLELGKNTEQPWAFDLIKANIDNLNKRVITPFCRQTPTKTLANVCDNLHRKRSRTCKEPFFRIVAARKLKSKQKNWPNFFRMRVLVTQATFVMTHLPSNRVPTALNPSPWNVNPCSYYLVETRKCLYFLTEMLKGKKKR